MLILNALSLNMVSVGEGSIRFKRISLETAKTFGELQSAIGHADTARVISSELGVNIPANRVDVALKTGDRALVAQYKGPRLPEGATTLPTGAEIQYFEVELFA